MSSCTVLIAGPMAEGLYCNNNILIDEIPDYGGGLDDWKINYLLLPRICITEEETEDLYKEAFDYALMLLRCPTIWSAVIELANLLILLKKACKDVDNNLLKGIIDKHKVRDAVKIFFDAHFYVAYD